MSTKGGFQVRGRCDCPHCGARQGVRNGVYGGRQKFRCLTCGKIWRGEVPPAREPTPCPYCKGHCRKAGWRNERTGRKPGRRGALWQWMDRGLPPPPPPPRVQQYQCTVCGKRNIELWPSARRGPRVAGGPQFTYPVTFCLNAAAEDALARYCQKHKLNWGQGVRAILREASYARMTSRWGKYDERRKPPVIPPGTPLPPLSDGRLAEAEKRRGKLWGHREVILTRVFSVGLDGAAYMGLLRTMEAKKMTRQEAARYLIVGKEGTFTCRTARMEVNDYGIGGREWPE